jgi:sialic acid synthase
MKIIAEIGGTHIGDLERAKYLASLAKENGADVVKTQKRNPRESVPKGWWDKPHPNEMFSYGKTYLEHRLNLELDQFQHAELKKYCEKIGIEYSTSIWDMTSAREIVELNPSMIKIPSACNHNTDMIDYLCDNYEGQIHISLGMTTASEREDIFNEYGPDSDANNDFVFYHCTSGYPVPFDKIYLKEIGDLAELLGEKNTGFSNHGYDIAMEPAAYVLGARWFERHFIDDRTFRHTDASCSLEPQGLKKLVRDLKAIEQANAYKPRDIDSLELEQRNKLRKN